MKRERGTRLYLVFVFVLFCLCRISNSMCISVPAFLNDFGVKPERETGLYLLFRYE